MNETLSILMIGALVWVPSVVALFFVIRDAVDRGRVTVWDVAAGVVVIGAGVFGAAVYLMCRAAARVKAGTQRPKRPDTAAQAPAS